MKFLLRYRFGKWDLTHILASGEVDGAQILRGGNGGIPDVDEAGRVIDWVFELNWIIFSWQRGNI